MKFSCWIFKQIYCIKHQSLLNNLKAKQIKLIVLKNLSSNLEKILFIDFGLIFKTKKNQMTKTCLLMNRYKMNLFRNQALIICKSIYQKKYLTEFSQRGMFLIQKIQLKQFKFLALKSQAKSLVNALYIQLNRTLKTKKIFLNLLNQLHKRDYTITIQIKRLHFIMDFTILSQSTTFPLQIIIQITIQDMKAIMMRIFPNKINQIKSNSLYQILLISLKSCNFLVLLTSSSQNCQKILQIKITRFKNSSTKSSLKYCSSLAISLCKWIFSLKIKLTSTQISTLKK
ncbi:hypothetical protein TTHERM_000404309 (macronuclear) [Tetrahymena thermophila SB210]|uniref:Uncharacterized protein n=1 Tax=Tetrahymena thermophila (strain SB210) TaxID=312017 RepID=W7XKD2_TETTS|nr:hypothetical protein TTHERM_000404309 [Tetrahymena thermophila SB210]EWS74799.1 hypothetical protein TTHERM_000404309 [Tetrahymena thermophila SB210]|eukprot:XP_012652692.1 hypothetical protein TTHERM_000404309 [Tetrahymena thermophila SB210]